MYLLISRLVHIDCKSVKAQNTNIITWPCPVLLVFWVWVMLIVSVVGGLGGVAGGRLTGRDHTERDSGLDLNSVSTLRSPPSKHSAAKDHREASIIMNISSSIDAGARQNWWSARDGPEFLLTLLWPLSVGLSEEWFGFYGQNGQNQKVRKTNFRHHTHTFPFAKFSQLSSHDIQSLLVAFPAPVLYKYHKIENK